MGRNRSLTVHLSQDFMAAKLGSDKEVTFMIRSGRRQVLMTLLAGLVGALMPMPSRAQVPVPPGTPVTITVAPAAAAAPPVSITLGARHGHATPLRSGCNHTGGGNIDIQQPSSDTVVITMTGVAVSYCGPKKACAGFIFDLCQDLDISFDNPKVKKAKLTMEGRVIGVLRAHSGNAQYYGACATVGSPEVGGGLTLCVPDHSASCGDNLSINDHEGPVSMPILKAGAYNLKQTFNIMATAPCCVLPCKAPSAEFAPDPALDPLWISYKEPFHGVAKKDFGFQITIRVADDS